jgi:hypothetical protein
MPRLVEERIARPRPLRPSADIGAGEQFVGQAAALERRDGNAVGSPRQQLREVLLTEVQRQSAQVVAHARRLEATRITIGPSTCHTGRITAALGYPIDNLA